MAQLVVFDLDGTITRRDTLLPYAWGFVVRSKLWRLPLLLGVFPSVVGYLLRKNDEGRIKAAFIRCALGGSRRSEIDRWTAQFVPRLLRAGVFNDAMERIAEHRGAGDYLVLMSASTDLYVPVIARQLGFAETICTEVRWNGDRLDGALTTPNRKGEEKARCFTRLREKYSGTSTTAYGNSSADLPHLRLATHGVLVNGSTRARRRAAELGITCVDWS
ncbi:MAG TPA: HAD-IB family hydrolase [Steroidobacteraceae bacterium]|nr:HAD-IB family hydrolase [Steroidobacteraceae bacterium]